MAKEPLAKRLVPGATLGHFEIAEVIGVAHDHMHQEVIGAGHVIERYDFGELLGVLAKTSDLGGLMTMQSDRNHRLEPNTNHCRIDVGVKAPERTRLLESPDALRAGRLGDPNPARDFFVGQARILLEKGHDGAICSVEHRILGHLPNTFHILLTFSVGIIVSNSYDRIMRR